MDAQDILLNNDNELQFFNGDFLVGNSDNQHVQTIIEANKGNFLETPTLGVGIVEYKSSNISAAELEKRVRIELQKDGYKLDRVTINGFNIQIEAKRIQ